MKVKIFILLLTFFILKSITIYAEKDKSQKQSSPKNTTKQKDEIKGQVDLIVGKAFIQKGKEWLPLSLKAPLLKTDTIKTEKDSKIKIKLSNGELLEIKANKVIRIETLLKKAEKEKGSKQLLKKIKKQDANQEGPSAVAGVRGKADSKKEKVKPDEVKWKEK